LTRYLDYLNFVPSLTLPFSVFFFTMKLYHKFFALLCIGFCFGVFTTQAQNKSLLFTATNNNTQLAGVTVADHNSLDFTTALTIEAWIKPSSFSPQFYQGTIVAKDNWAGNTVNTGYVLRCGGAGVLDFTYGDGVANNPWRSFTSVNSVLTTNAWQHVAVTFSRNSQNVSVKMYVNGVQVSLTTTGTVNNGNAIATNTQDLGIGTDLYDSKYRNFNGLIQHVRLWNVERSAYEIKAYRYISEIICPRTGLVAHYKFNESAGNTCFNTYFFAPSGTITTVGNGTVTRQASNSGASSITAYNLYVKAGVTNSNETGTSWENAFSNLQDALAFTRNCSIMHQIWVAAGTYYPSTTGDRDASFRMINDVSILGGFPNTGNPTLAQRDFINNPTILSGDIGTVGNSGDNSKNIFKNLNLDNTAVLDGFTISDAYSNIATENVFGGGMQNISSSPSLNNIIFEENRAYKGGAISNNGSNPILKNVIFDHNTATQGGALYSHTNSSFIVSNAIFKGNSTSNKGACIYLTSTSTGTFANITMLENTDNSLTPSIFYGELSSSFNFTNSIISGDFLAQSGSQISISFSYLSAGVAPRLTTSIGNIFSSNSLNFLNRLSSKGADGKWFTADDGWQLTSTSPCINRGRFGSNVSNTDILGNARSSQPDMGAYEYTSCFAPNRIYVKSGVQGGNGTSWADAFDDLQYALGLASSCNTVTEIWVAAGTYKPTTTTDRSISFSMINNVGIYGGFVGTETALSQRDWKRNSTILSGDIGTLNNDLDNSYSVIYNSFLDNTAMLDGFTITKGYSKNSTTILSGAGMFNTESAPTLRNLIFLSNASLGNGGGMAIYNNALLSLPYLKDMDMRNIAFEGNSATYGGGLFNNNNGGVTTLKNVLFYNNQASSNGGAVYNIANALYINATIYNNQANNSGGIYNFNSSIASSSLYYNCIVWANTAANNPQVSGQNITLRYSDIDGGYAGVGNINSNPNFMNPASPKGADGLYFTGDDGFTLKNTSPCIDTGINGGVNNGISFNSPTSDVVSFPRNTIPDMGAYEARILVSQTSGAWENSATWLPNLVPTINDYTTISTGHIVTVNNTTQYPNITADVLKSLTMKGTLKFITGSKAHIGY
jgi:predicted outer membrane repeat protein